MGGTGIITYEYTMIWERMTLTSAESRLVVGMRGRYSVRGHWRRRASTAAPLIPAGSAADAGCRRGTRRRRIRTRHRRPEVRPGTTATWRQWVLHGWRCWLHFVTCCWWTSAASRPLPHTQMKTFVDVVRTYWTISSQCAPHTITLHLTYI